MAIISVDKDDLWTLSVALKQLQQDMTKRIERLDKSQANPRMSEWLKDGRKRIVRLKQQMMLEHMKEMEA